MAPLSLRALLAAALFVASAPAQASTLNDAFRLYARPTETDLPDEEEEEDEPVESFDVDLKDDEPSEPGEPEDGVRAARPAAPELDIAGKSPFGDNFRPTVVSSTEDTVVVELPLLIAATRATATFDQPIVVTADVLVDRTRVAQVQHRFDAASLSVAGPTFAHFKATVPVTTKEGEFRIEVRRANADGTSATLLFVRVVGYDI